MPLDSVVAADLLARLLTDDRFRAEFRSDPVGTCRGMGLDDVADELERESARAFQTLEIRESRSSLAGVLLAAAAEGIGVAELVQTMRAGDGDRWQAAAALSRAMPAVRDAGLPVDVPDEAGDTPTCPLCLLREPGAPPARTKCSVCGEAGPPGVVICPTCIAESSGAAAPAAGLAAPAPTGPPPAMPPAVATPPPPVQAGAVPNGSSVPEPAGQAATPAAPALQEVRAPADPAPAAARAAVAAPGPAGPDAPGSAGRRSAVFGVVPSPASRTPEAAPGAVALQARPAVVPAPALAEVAPAPAAGAAPGAPSVAPIDPSQLNNTNAGGKLHGSEFNVHDAEGAPGPSGNLHAGYDFFAKENAPIRSPISGTVVEVRASRGTSGQIFGGTVKVQGADGKVWVFRHVTPGSVSVGQKVEAGTQIAVVSPWTDGPEHTHIELWKTLGGGYNVPNMEDPLPHLKALYSGNGTSLPANGASSPAGVAQAVPAPSAPVAVAAVAGAPVAAAVSPADLIANPNVVALPQVAAELASPDLDPRVVSMLGQVADRYEIGLTSVETDGDLSRIIITSVNGRPVGPSNVDARDLAQELADLDPSARPSEVGTPWKIKGKGFFTEPGLGNRLEVGYRASDASIGASTTPQVQQPTPTATPGADVAADAAASLPADDAALAAQLDAWMARKNPGAPLQGYGAVFVREGKANGVDPRLLVAIARAESSLGSDPGAISINNAFGWGPHKPFPTWDENIATVAKGLRTGYIDDGLDTINEIQKRYCPVGAANDPTGVNANWLGNVRLLYAELGGDPDGSVALAPSGQAAPPVAPLVAQPQVLASPVGQVPSSVPPPAATPAVEPSKGRASAVFGAVAADGAKKPGADAPIARPNTARVLPAVPDPAKADPLPVASTTPAATDTPGAGAVADAIPAAGTRGAQIVAIAKAELDRGVAEEPSGSNNSERIAEYRTATAGSGVGPWCAYFTSWVAKQAGVPVGEGGSGIGYVPTLKNWAEQTDRYIPNGSGPPQVGDLVVFDWQGDGVLDHVGVVSGVRPDGGIETIEGNAGDKIATRSYGPDGYAGLVRLAAPGDPPLATPALAPQGPAVAAPLKAVPDPAAAAPGVAAQAEVRPKAPPSAGRASAVFGAVPADGARTPGAPAAPTPASPAPQVQQVQQVQQPTPTATPGADVAADAAASLPADDAALAAQLDAWMARKNPGAPLQGYGAVFVREGKANGVDPRLLVAIARAESSLGSDPGAISINNAFGWGPHKPFPTWDENIATVAKGLRTGYIDDGLDTINEIQKRYCPVGAANDPTGVNANWLGNVRLLYAELGGDPDGSVALAPSGQAAPPVAPLVAQPQVLASPVGQVPSSVPPPAATPAVEPSKGRASAVFGAVAADGAKKPGADAPIARPNTARVLPAVPDPAKADPLPVASTTPAATDTPGAGAVADAIPAAGTRGAQIVAIAKAELDRGVAEEPSGSNNSERIAEYRTATAGSGVGPWCAYFTSWVAKQAGVPVGEGGSGIGYVPTLKNWAEQTDRYIPNGSGPPQVGDLVVFDWQGDGVLDHVGVVSGVRPDGGIETIEGNAGDKIATRSYGPDGYAGLVRLAAPGDPPLATPALAPQGPAVAAPLKAVPDPAAAAPGVAAPAAAQAEVRPKAPPSAGRASAVFGAVPADGARTPGAPAADGRIARPNTARVLPAVPDPAKAAQAAPTTPPPAAPPPSTTPPPVAAEQVPAPSAAVAGVVDAYPGDNAPKEQIAMWMARTAQAAGLPPELPVMAGLVESGLSNLDHGHADSLGFFQMRESVWNSGEYAGYSQKPELQLKWFLDQATAIKKKRLDEGLTTFGTNPAGFGEWIADVERPAEQYRGRYQLRLAEARALIFGVPGTR